MQARHALSRCVAGMLLIGAAGIAAAEFPMQAQEVAPGIHAVVTPVRDFPTPENRGWNSNTAFVVTNAGVLQFDTGSSRAIGAGLREVVAGVTDRPVRWVVNSHAHGDHWLGNGAFAGEGVDFIATQVVRDIIANDGAEWVRRFANLTDGATGESAVVVPNVVVGEHERRDLGGVAVEFIGVGRSHSPGDMVAWLPESRVLLAADVVYSDRLPAVFDADIRHWIETLNRLEALEPLVVVPGHGEVSDVASIRLTREFLERLWGVVEEGQADGKTDFEILPEVRERLADFRERYPDFDRNIGAAVSHAYLQVERAAFGG